MRCSQLNVPGSNPTITIDGARGHSPQLRVHQSSHIPQNGANKDTSSLKIIGREERNEIPRLSNAIIFKAASDESAILAEICLAITHA